MHRERRSGCTCRRERAQTSQGPTRTLRAVGIFLLFAFPTELIGESPLVVVDSDDVVVGQIVDLGNWTAGEITDAPTVLYRLDSGGFALFRFSGGGDMIWPYGFLFYESADCTGQAYAAQYYFAPTIPLAHNPLFYLHLVNGELGSQTIYRVFVRETPVEIALGSIFTGSECVPPAPGFPTTFVPAEMIEPLRVFTPPYFVKLNPVLFNDGFVTGDLTRWSNF